MHLRGGNAYETGKRKTLNWGHLRMQSVIHAFLFTFFAMMLYPLALAVWGSLMTQWQFGRNPWIIQFPLWIPNYQHIVEDIWRPFINTLIVAFASLAGVLFQSILPAYAFARISMPGKRVLFIMVLSLMMFPAVLTLIPSYMLWHSFNLTNTLAVLIIPSCALPIFFIFLLRGFFASMPEDLFEAARLDGAGLPQILRYIAVPLAAPVLGTIVVMHITNVWNDLVWPLITVTSRELYTMMVYMTITFGNRGVVAQPNYPVQFAISVTAAVPLIIIFLFASKSYVEGMISSGMKL